MEIICAECGCRVDHGVRIVPCADHHCCCSALPLAAQASPASRDRQSKSNH